MQFTINPAIFAQYPGTTIGVVIAKGIDNTQTKPELAVNVQKESQHVKNTFTSETLGTHAKIQCWRAAYQKFGAKPSEYRSSIENLYRMCVNGKEVRSINSLVDIYNSISLKHMLPAGGEDLDQMRGDLLLTLAGENETPVQLLGEKDARPPYKGEVIYKDDVSTICRRWNWREADRTKLTNATTNAILVLEGVSPITEEEVETATRELAALVRQHCGGKLQVHILHAQNPRIEF